MVPYANEYYDCAGDCLSDVDGDLVCDENEFYRVVKISSACNYDETATDEGSCTYAEDNFDCDGECIVDVDCNGVCGGDSIQDACNNCDGPGCSDENGVAAPFGGMFKLKADDELVDGVIVMEIIMIVMESVEEQLYLMSGVYVMDFQVQMSL